MLIMLVYKFITLSTVADTVRLRLGFCEESSFVNQINLNLNNGSSTFPEIPLLKICTTRSLGFYCFRIFRRRHRIRYTRNQFSVNMPHFG